MTKNLHATCAHRAATKVRLITRRDRATLSCFLVDEQ